jgi:glycoside hydrolase-like protein
MRILLASLSVALIAAPAAGPENAAQRTYLGFDLNTYPGDEALATLRQNFVFAGYWLSPPPGSTENTWMGKREVLRAQRFGFLLLYAGPQSKALKSATQAEQNGMRDAQSAATAAKREGFPPRSMIFLDIEEGGRLPEKYHADLRGWAEGLARAGFRAGVYCSGMPVDEGGGVSIVTADDIRNHIGKRELAYWVFNDACPPAPGCGVLRNPPAPSASGVAYATVWQFAQSPRRKEFTARCATTYNADGNCYAPGDKAHAWFLDVNSATTPDPSGAR